jgi:hypothetical protein
MRRPTYAAGALPAAGARGTREAQRRRAPPDADGNAGLELGDQPIGDGLEARRFAVGAREHHRAL